MEKILSYAIEKPKSILKIALRKICSDTNVLCIITILYSSLMRFVSLFPR